MSYPGNYNQSSYPPVTGNPPTAQYQQTPYPQQQGYPPQQGYPQQGGYPPPQQAYPQQAYPPPQQAYPPPQQAYPSATYPPQPYPAAAAYASPYPPASSWAPTAAYPAVGYATPAVGYATPAVGYAAPVAYAAPMAVAMPMMPAMNYGMQFRGVHLDRKDIFSKSDPFLVLWASKHPGGYHAAHNIARRERKETKKNKKFGGMSGNWVMVYRSETIHNNQNPMWAPFNVNLITLCGGNMDTVFKVEVWDSDVHSNHDFIGGAVTTIRELQTSKEVRLVNKRRIGIYNSSGRLEVVRCAPA